MLFNDCMVCSSALRQTKIEMFFLFFYKINCTSKCLVSGSQTGVSEIRCVCIFVNVLGCRLFRWVDNGCQCLTS